MKKFIMVVIVGMLILGLASGWWLRQGLSPAVVSKGVSVEPVQFVIRSGESVTSIADRLTEADLISNPLVFRGLVRYLGIEKAIQAGSFSLLSTQTPQEIAIALTQGTQDIWITLPEGLRREEIAQRLENYELSEFSSEEFLEQTTELEGQLFPDTYLVPREISTTGLIELFTTTFNNKTGKLDFTQDSPNPFSFEEYLVLASLIQREARTEDDMRRVAGILHNRIKIGMPLQVDATLQYAKGYSQEYGRWWGYPVPADKSIPSIYNTYLNAGLPPRPIANPGLVALEAAVDPLLSDDLYYLHAPDGSMYYGETLEQHNRNVDTYLR